jgi:hypothetical protein
LTALPIAILAFLLELPDCFEAHRFKLFLHPD